jgi:hypothetical protein
MLKRILLLSAVALSGTQAIADSTATPVINQRQANQDQRIDQGVQSGALTNRETKTLDAREDKIASDKAAAKADGNVTPAERSKLRGEERRTSRAIYRKKHNARTAPAGT